MGGTKDGPQVIFPDPPTDGNGTGSHGESRRSPLHPKSSPVKHILPDFPPHLGRLMVYGGVVTDVYGGGPAMSLARETRSRPDLALAVLVLALIFAPSSAGKAQVPPAAGDRPPAPAHQTVAQEGGRLDASLNRATETQQLFLKTYCVSCHNDRLKTGGLSIENKPPTEASREDLVTWEKVVRKVRTGAMPPANARRPDQPMRASFVRSLEATLDAKADADPNPGRPMTLHRLNRVEYFNAVRDLFGIELNTDELSRLPPDDSSYGFDNIADVLGLPPVLLERYLSVARRVVRLAMSSRSTDVDTQTHVIPYALSQNEWFDGMPFGSRGGTRFIHQFPVDGEYSIRIRLQRSNQDTIVGLSRPKAGERVRRERLQIALDGVPVALFSIGYDRTVAEPPDASLFAIIDQPPTVEPTDEAVKRQSTKGDEPLEVRTSIKAGPREISATFLAQAVAVSEKSARAPMLAGLGGPARLMGVDSVTVSGPTKVDVGAKSSSRSRIFVCSPRRPAEENACATKILHGVATRAFRRPVTAEETQALMRTYREGRTSAGDFERGIAQALRRVIVSPAFLFRIEKDPSMVSGRAIYRLGDYELASRLSFFLWSSIPNGDLLDKAEKGLLHEPLTLRSQVRRMLLDSRAKALIQNFASEWLGLRGLTGVQPDPIIFPEFDARLKDAFRRETELFLESVLFDPNKSVTELLDAKYTFLNERLARHYDVLGVYGDQFRRVELTDSVRGGLLAQGSILALTSFPNRTSPVLRGKWILENILGSPPPPPPPVVPPLPEEASNGKVMTMRERLSEHRKNPVCASCHARMDPLGFSLENFDATGKWRVLESSGPADTSRRPIDASGELIGQKFNGLSGLRETLKPYYSEFIYAMTEKLMTYALGRGVEYYDAPAIRKVVREAAADGSSFTALVDGVTKSLPFQARLAQPDDQMVGQTNKEQR